MLEPLYGPLKTLHMTAVAVSLTLFVWRGALMLAGSARLGSRFLRIAPHAVDTVLLASALLLCLAIGQYPFGSAWLTAKLLALIAYIGLGLVALRLGRTRAVRFLALVAALLVVAYIIGTALHHDPDPRHW